MGIKSRVEVLYIFFLQVIQEAIDVSHEKTETLKLASKASELTQPVRSQPSPTATHRTAAGIPVARMVSNPSRKGSGFKSPITRQASGLSKTPITCTLTRLVPLKLNHSLGDSLWMKTTV